MFQQLSDRLTATVRGLTGQGRLTEKNIDAALHDVRTALLEADVALPIVKEFIERIRRDAIGQAVISALKPGEALVKLVHDALVELMGETNSTLNLKTQPPAVLLMVGLQGSGKTTTAAKLAYRLKNHDKKSVLLASADIYRPAAIEQLNVLAREIDVPFFLSTIKDKPVSIAKAAIDQARKRGIDVVIIDTAGRLHIDATMMDEIKSVHEASNPIETLLVVDCMTGQDAVNSAKAFDEALPLTGVILTKTDGDARGGAALTLRETIKKPIKFLGVGEKIDALEAFHPDRLASRILGMGDILTLVEEAERKLDQKKISKMTRKVQKGGRFDLADFQEQLQQMKKMGGLSSLLGKLPGLPKLPPAAKSLVDDSKFARMGAIIDSMTLQERHFPAVIKGSRKRRIANGSGTEVQHINQLLKQFAQMQKMMQKMKGQGMQKMMQKMKDILP